MYITYPQLAERPGVRELAQVATPEAQRPVADALMTATLLDADRSSFEPADIAIADAALKRIDDAIADAIGVIDGFLGRRGYLPFAAGAIPAIVTAWCRAITRYFLHQHRLNADDKDPITRDYKDAMKLLQLTADGKFSLGVEDTQVPIGAGEPLVIKGSTPVRDALRDY